MTNTRRDIIDNSTEGITMGDVLNSAIPNTKNLDISTGYFNLPGYAILRDTLGTAAKNDEFKLRLLLGSQALLPEATFEELAQENNEDAISLKRSLDDADLLPESMSDTASLLSLLHNENVEVKLGKSRFNHSKCYITDNTVFIGSSNFTNGGLMGNYELNAGLYQPSAHDLTMAWFDKMWEMSKDVKQDLIDLLTNSKFGVPDTPYNIYIKMIFEKYRDLLTPDTGEDHYKVDLTEFQKDAVRTSLFIMSEFQGAMIADATGLGKTNMGMEILRQKILRENRKVLLVAPSQVLHSMWSKKLEDAGLAVRKKVTMESLGTENALKDSYQYHNIDFILIDESQNFRSKGANRSQNLAKIMTMGKRKQVLLLSATPINNSIMDLYYQVSIITRRDDAYFWRTIGIPDLYLHMRDAANKEGGLAAGLEKIQRLLDAIMVRRTRSYIKEVYPNDSINGNPIKFPKHEYTPIHYSLADLYGNVFQRILEDMHSLTMAPYGLEQYNTKAPEEEKAKHRVLAHLQVILLLKRFESSVEAIKASLNNKIRLYEHIGNVASKGRMVMVSDLNKIIAKANQLEVEDDSTEPSEKPETDEFILGEIEKLGTEKLGKEYDMEKFQGDLKHDLKILSGLLAEVEGVRADKKLESVRDGIERDKALRSGSKKVLIFTEYKTTARYLLREIRRMFPGNRVECIMGDTRPETRLGYIERFAPKSNLSEDQRLEDEEIDILVSTEVLAEGQNLQDCNYVINYDLPWNPMRIVQRIGRVDRLTSMYDTIHSRACYPDKELDDILKLMGKLIKKVQTVNDVIGLDAELLGETPSEKQYNGNLKDTIKVFGEGGEAATEAIEQIERESDLMPQNTPLNEIARRAKEIGIDELKSMPFGRRSGKAGDRKACVLAYLREKPRYVYFVEYDYARDEAHVPDNEYDAINKVRCFPDEGAYLPGDDGMESFEELVRIDRKAREAIELNDDAVKKYVQNKNTSSDKIRMSVKRILTDALKSGTIDAEKTRVLGEIANRVELMAWENDVKDSISRYEDGGDINQFIHELENVGKEIGINEDVVEDIEIDYKKLKLVGAMFITPEEGGELKKGV